MKLSQLREHLAKIPDKYLDVEVKVWLPGSTIRLSPMLLEPYHGNLLLEGNVDPGSALEDLSRAAERAINRTPVYEIRRVSRKEYRLFLDGRRTGYSGDSYEEANKMKLHLEGAFPNG